MKKLSTTPPSRSSRQRGQALIEVLVAISVLTIGLLGVISLLSRALGLNRVVADNYIATYLAAEGVEVVKNIIDSNGLQGRPWNTGLSDGTYELEESSLVLQAHTPPARQIQYDPTTQMYGYSGSVVTPFRRQISIALLSNGTEIQVNSQVSWVSRGGGSFNTDLEDHFFDWKP